MDPFAIAPKETWKDLLEEISRRTGMTATLYNAGGDALLRCEAWANELCPRIQASREALTTICSVAQQTLGRQAVHTREPVIDECDLGMVKFVVPIMRGEEVVGTLGACGRRDPGSEVDPFLSARVLGVQESDVARDAAGVEAVAPELIEETISRIRAALKRLGAD